MLKKIFALFHRPVPEKSASTFKPVRCYQPELPFE